MRLRLALPAGLIVIGILGLAGCIYLPVAEHPRTPDGRDVRDVVGGSASRKPVRIGVTHRLLVLQLLGEPGVRAKDDRAFAYSYDVIAGHWYGLCASRSHEVLTVPADVPAKHELFLEFDEAGLLKRYEFHRHRGPVDSGEVNAWPEFLQKVPG